VEPTPALQAHYQQTYSDWQQLLARETKPAEMLLA
jgi:xylulokinase